jgi:uncharacterized protein (DUF736 family)
MTAATAPKPSCQTFSPAASRLLADASLQKSSPLGSSVTKQADGRYTGHLRTVSIKAEIDIVPNVQKNSEALPDFRVLTEGIEIGAGWMRKGETSGKEYVRCGAWDGAGRFSLSG